MNNEMRFFIPGREMLAEPYHLKGIGLPHVYLLNAVEIEDDPDEGELVTIENMKGLYRAIGLHIIAKREALSGEEFRFLRKLMGLTQAELGEKMSVSDQTVANYEKEKTAPPPATAHMKLLCLLDLLPANAAADLIKEVVRIAKDTGLKLPELPSVEIAEGWREKEKIAA